MAQDPVHPPERMPQRNLIMAVAFAAAALLGGYFGGQFQERNRAVTPQTKLQVAVEAFRSGYDQAALSMLKPLADEGSPKAQYWLADIYENGLGVKRDMPTALSLLEKSAAQGFVPAERHLGELYLRGTGTLQDFGKAQTWLRKAAIAGDAGAQRQLGHINALGLGVAADLPQAYGWYANAVLGGDGLAPHMRDDILQRMSPEQIAKGEQMAKDTAGEIKAAAPAKP